MQHHEDTDSESTISYIEASDDEVGNDEITFEIHSDEESTTQKSGKKPNTKEIVAKNTRKESTLNIEKNVTDHVTDNQVNDNADKGNKCSWVSVSEEITEADFMSSDSSQDKDAEIIEVCERWSKEFELSLQKIVDLPTNNNEKITNIFQYDLPESVVWSSILTALYECTDFTKLEELCHNLKREMPPLKPRVNATFSVKCDKVDHVAQTEIPSDGPRMLKAIRTTGDGNCLSQSVSRGYFNTESKHLELHARMVVEGVVNKRYYLNDDFLARGTSYIHKNADLPTVFTRFSEYYSPGQKLTEDAVSCIYSLEIHSIAKEGTYMGLWQLAQAASILCVPLHTIYPV